MLEQVEPFVPNFELTSYTLFLLGSGAFSAVRYKLLNQCINQAMIRFLSYCVHVPMLNLTDTFFLLVKAY